MMRKIPKDSSYNSRKRRRWLVFILLLFIIITIIYFGFNITQINVMGCDYYTEEQIIEKVIVNKRDHNSIYLYLKNLFVKPTEIPFIQQYDIEIVNRSTIDINVYEKTMIGCIRYMGQILYFDKDGMIVESSNRKIDYVPFVVGLQYEKLVLHEKLELEQEKLLDTILNITQLIRKYELSIETITFTSNHEIILISGDIRILLGKHDVYDEQMANLANIMPKTIGLKGELDMEDFSEEDETFIFRPAKQ